MLPIAPGPAPGVRAAGPGRRELAAPGGNWHVPGFRSGAGVRPRARDRDGGPEVLRPVGTLAPRHDPGGALQRGHDGEGGRVRRLQRRLQDRERGRHGDGPGPRHRLRGPVLGGPDALVRLHDARGGHAPALPVRPAQHRPERRAAPARERHRRLEPVGARVRVLPVRRRRVRERHERRVVPRRVGRGRLVLAEARAAATTSRATAATTRSRRRTTCTTPAPVSPEPPGNGDRGQVPPPRGRRPGPVRDRDPLHAGAGRRGHHDAGEVRHPHDRGGDGDDRDVHAEAAVRRGGLGTALPPAALEGRGQPVLRRRRVRHALRRRRARSSRACCSTAAR